MDRSFFDPDRLEGNHSRSKEGHTPAMSGWPALLLLADGRFPAGGHAHSGGVEAAALAGLVHDVATLAAFLDGRLSTTGLVDAALAAAAAVAAGMASGARSDAGVAGVLAQLGDDLACLDAEAAARVPSPAQRAASRAQGAQLLRAARTAWPSPVLDALAGRPQNGCPAAGPMHPVVVGAVAAAAGVGPEGAAALVCHHCVTGPAGAAVRLLGLDPFAVHAVVAALAPTIEAVAADAVRRAAEADDPADLPAVSAVVPELAADAHIAHPDALFAS